MDFGLKCNLKLGGINELCNELKTICIMRNSAVLKGFLIVSGLLLSFIGGSTLVIPIVMKSNAGIDIAGQISVLNDTRAFGAFLLTFGILSILGGFLKGLRYTSSLVITLLFLSLGVGRALSLSLDGMPVDGLVKATILEFVLGIIGLILFKVYQEKKI